MKKFAGVLAIAALMASGPAAAFAAPPDNRPPSNRPPNKTPPNQQEDCDLGIVVGGDIICILD